MTVFAYNICHQDFAWPLKEVALLCENCDLSSFLSLEYYLMLTTSLPLKVFNEKITASWVADILLGNLKI